MPLIKGKSKESFGKNVSTEMHAGKPMKQSLAIAYAMKRKAKKMAMGGEVEGYQPDYKYREHPDLRDHEKDSGFVDHEGDDVKMDHAAMMEDDKDINQHGDMDGELVDRIMMKRQMMAEGGVVADEGEDELSHLDDGKDNDFDYLSSGDLDDSTTNSGAADGDFLGDKQEDEDRRDIVARIMKSRAKKDRLPRPA